MKTNRIIAALFVVAMLSLTPAMAQSRGGGSHGGGGGSRGGSVSSSSHSSSSHSSSSMGSRSSSSHSSSSVSRPSSSSSVSRPSSSSSVSRPSSSTSVSRPSSSSSVSRPSSSSSVSRPSGTVTRPSTSGSRPSGTVTRPSTSGSRPAGSVGRPSGAPSASRPAATPHKDQNGPSTGRGTATNVGGDSHRQGPQPGVNGGRPGNPNQGGYDRPGDRPGGHPGHPGHPGAPHANHPVHPVFHHPYHHHMMHMHCVYWDPYPLRPVYWPGFWMYCNDYWYDYHTTNIVVVHDHARSAYNIDLVSYAISGDLMYALVNETDGNTYLQVFDSQDRMLAEQKVSRKYNKCEIDRENGGCWIFKKGDKDPLLFIYNDGQFLIYEAD